MTHTFTVTFQQSDARGRELSCVVTYVDNESRVCITSRRGDIESVNWETKDSPMAAAEFYYGLSQRQHYLRNYTLWRTAQRMAPRDLSHEDL